MLWQKRVSKKAWLKIQPDEDLARALAGQAGQTDRFISVNEFKGWRLVKLLRSLRACYVDLDECPTIEAALYAVDDAGLPRPSYALHSGRGVHLYWILEAVSAQALPVWQAIQAQLITALAGVGADKVARDCTRVLRLAGTINSKVDREVLGYVIEPGRWTLHQLADEVLGHRQCKAPVTSLERARAVRRAVRRAAGPYRLWHSRYLDLCTIADYHSFLRPGVPEGNRDKLLFLLANALSWFTRADTLHDEIQRVARTYTPTLSDGEAATYTKTIVQRAVQAAEGVTVQFDGAARDSRYAFKTETLREWLGELITPELEGRLKVLVPRQQLQARERERQKSRDRVREGRYQQTRSDYEAKAACRRSAALGLAKQGLGTAEIATQLGVTSRSVRSWIQKAEKSAPLV